MHPTLRREAAASQKPGLIRSRVIRACCIALGLAALGSMQVATLESEPPPAVGALPTAPKDVAAEAVRAAGAGDQAALRGIANLGTPDLWEVVDELQAQDASGVVRQLVDQVALPAERVQLDAFLAGSRSTPGDTAIRTAFDEALQLAGDARATALQSLVRHAAPEGAASSLLHARIAREYALALEAVDPGADVAAAWIRAQSAAQQLGWVRPQLEALLVRAQRLRAQSSDEEAEGLLWSAKFLAEPYVAWPLAGAVLRALGNVLTAEGKYSEAVAAYSDGAHVMRRAGLPEGEAECLTLAGSVQLALGDLLAAFGNHERARGIAAAAGAVDVLQDIEINTAALYEMSGRPEEALETLGRALEAASDPKHGSRINEAIVLGNRARSRYLAGDVEGALDDIGACQSLFSKLEEPEGVWQCMTERAWYRSRGQVDEQELAALRQELAVAGDQMSPRRRTIFHEVVGRCEWRLGRTDAALAAFDKAVSLTEAGMDQGETLRADIWGQRGALLMQAGRDDAAWADIGRYLDALLDHVDGYECASPRTFRGIVAGEVFAAGVGLGLRSASLERTWRTVEASRGIRLLAALGGRSGLDDALVKPELKTGMREAQEAETRARSRLAAADPAEREQAKAALDAAVRSRQDAAEKVGNARKSLRQRALQDLGGAASILSIQQVEALLQAGQAVVSLSVVAPGPDILAIVVEKGKPARTVSLKGREDALRQAARLRELANTSRSTLDPAEARSLSKSMEESMRALRGLLIDPLKLRAELKLVTFVPDGPLSLVPFGALLYEQDHSVAVQTSASLIPHLQGASRGRRGTHRLAIGIGDYSGRALKSDLRVAATLSPPDLRGSLMRLGPLPHARAEAEAVAGPTGTILLDGEATAQGLGEALVRLKGVPLETLHFACHGVPHAQLATLSGLALSDGMLTALEIAPWDLTTDMVVLSACQTATDPYVTGEGMTGLVRSFLLAGSPRVIASLWKVPDEPTALLMGRFYELLAANRALLPATALREAQAFVRKAEGGKWASPENWAAWMLWGAP